MITMMAVHNTNTSNLNNKSGGDHNDAVPFLTTATTNHDDKKPKTIKTINKMKNQQQLLRFYGGLILANAGSATLTCLFGLLHLQVFLESYHLPLATYSIGSTIFAIINTANDVAGAWLVDSLVALFHREKHDLVGISGCLFAMCFLSPFFFGGDNNSPGNSSWWSGFHFVTTMSLYDSMWSFHCILLSSIITDHSTMSEKDRMTYLATGKIIKMIIPMMVAKNALAVFQINNLQPLRQYLLGVAILVSIVSMIAQSMLNSSTSSLSTTQDHQNDHDHHSKKIKKKQQKLLQFRQVVRDFIRHPNFCYWIGMEIMMEAQTTFMRSFMKTFVDNLLLGSGGSGGSGGLSRSTCDWFLSSLPLLIGITDLLLYIPIRIVGYAKVYSIVFRINTILALSLVVAVGGGLSSASALDETNFLEYTTPIFAYLCLYTVLTGAMGGAGFGLAMADMVLEMKVQKANDSLSASLDEPSIAGLFMGVNALFCKPAESVLPIVTATLFKMNNITNFAATEEEQQLEHDQTTNNTTSIQTILFRLLVLPPLICSMLQYYIWSRYDLKPTKTQAMRKEWENLVVANRSSGNRELESTA